MALDGYMYDGNKNKLDYFPIDDSLHEAIFENWNGNTKLDTFFKVSFFKLDGT